MGGCLCWGRGLTGVCFLLFLEPLPGTSPLVHVSPPACPPWVNRTCRGFLCCRRWGAFLVWLLESGGDLLPCQMRGLGVVCPLSACCPVCAWRSGARGWRSVWQSCETSRGLQQGLPVLGPGRVACPRASPLPGVPAWPTQDRQRSASAQGH